MKDKVTFLIISDAHGSAENVKKLSEEAKKADFVLFGGDSAKFGEGQTAFGVLDALVGLSDAVFAVRGNCDEETVLTFLENAGICVERSLTFRDGFAFCGAGGGTKFSLDTPFERDEDEIVSDLLVSKTPEIGGEDGVPLVLIVHNPPKNTNCDKIPGDVHVGSEKIRAFIEDVQPLLVVTGHIHESAGVSVIGSATVVNPGSLLEGKYAVAFAQKNEEKWNIANVELKNL